MNYCPNCGTKVESFWNVCANCGYRLSKEVSSTIIEKKPQKEEIQIATTKESYNYFKPQKKQGPYALTFGIIGFGLSIVTLILRINPILTFIAISLVINNLFIFVMGITAVIFGFIGIFKDDSKGMAIAGLNLGAGIFILFYIRFVIYLRYSIIPI
ncbi:MAG: zinc ribbon domain-containing protein [Promethearchaeota archaeon]